MQPEDPYHILELDPEASDEEIRAAYLHKVRQHPPERDPEAFERVRDAYDILRDPRRRMRNLLFSGDPLPPLDRLLEGRRAVRNFVGPKPWLAVLKQQ